VIQLHDAGVVELRAARRFAGSVSVFSKSRKYFMLSSMIVRGEELTRLTSAVGIAAY
jgi:hypothetical protein